VAARDASPVEFDEFLTRVRPMLESVDVFTLDHAANSGVPF
jgi:hypothetical protein